MAGENPQAFFQLRQLQEMLSELQTQHNNLARNFRQSSAELVAERESRAMLETRLKELQGQIAANKESSLRPRTINDIPGVRLPKWYELNIPIAANATQASAGSVEIEPDGPFICTQMQCYFEITAAGSSGFPVGTLLPTTKYALTRLQAPTITGTNFTSSVQLLGNVIPELSIRIQTLGSGRFWTGQTPVSTAAFYAFNGTPLYLAEPGWVDATDRIQVSVFPDIASGASSDPPSDVAGDFKMVFHGFQILNPGLRLTQVLNYGA